MLFLLIGGARLDGGADALSSLDGALQLSREVGARPVLVGEVMNHATSAALECLRSAVEEYPDLVVVADPGIDAEAIAAMVVPENTHRPVFRAEDGGLEVAARQDYLTGQGAVQAHWCPDGTSKSGDFLSVGPSWGIPGTDISTGTVLVDTDKETAEFYDGDVADVVRVEAPECLGEPVPEGSGVLVVQGTAQSWGDVAAYVDKARDTGYVVTVQVGGVRVEGQDEGTVEGQVEDYLRDMGAKDIDEHMRIFSEVV